MNARSTLVILGLFGSMSAYADHVYTSAKWNGWEVSTSEELWIKHRHTSYPIWQMFDGDPKTAWVYSGGFDNWRQLPSDSGDDPTATKKLPALSTRYWIQLTPDKGTAIDEIRIMNGYNKDEATFGRNARITRIDLFAMNSNGTSSGDKKKIGSYELEDAMGSRSVRIPRKKYESLRIEVSGLKHGTDPDLAVSEIQLLDKGKDVGPGRPSEIIYNAGDECGCGSMDRLITPDGRTLVSNAAEMEGISASPTGRYYSGYSASNSGSSIRLWVYDGQLRKVAWSKRYKDGNYPTVKFDRQGRLREAEYGPWDKVRLHAVLWRPSVP